MNTSDKLNKSVDDHFEYTKGINIKMSDIDYSIAEKHIPMLEMLDSLQTGIIVVYDYYKHNYFFFSKKFDKHFGFHKNQINKTNQEWFRKRLNPEDYFINSTGIKAREYIQKQAIEERKNYKLIAEFRLLNDNNDWIRITMQDHILELDKKGNIWLVLKILDFSPNQDTKALSSGILQNLSTGKVILSAHDEDLINISSREKEVLGLIAKGLKSREISEQLFISKNTVNNHRRNIIDKLNVSNTQEAVFHAKKHGII